MNTKMIREVLVNGLFHLEARIRDSTFPGTRKAFEGERVRFREAIKEIDKSKANAEERELG